MYEKGFNYVIGIKEPMSADEVIDIGDTLYFVESTRATGAGSHVEGRGSRSASEVSIRRARNRGRTEPVPSPRRTARHRSRRAPAPANGSCPNGR